MHTIKCKHATSICYLASSMVHLRFHSPGNPPDVAELKHRNQATYVPLLEIQDAYYSH